MNFFHTLSQLQQLALPLFTSPMPAGPKDPTWFDNPAITVEMLPAVGETLAMAGLSSLATVIIGAPLGLILVGTNARGLFPMRTLNLILGFIVNVGRSVPFIILALAIVPFTRLLAGTSIGWQAACVSLTIAAVPFFARLVESNIMGVSEGKIEAAKMMGASPSQIMWGVQIREGLPALIQSTTVLIITLIGYGAVTGTFGGGGLGQLAINYGHYQFQSDTMLVAVVLITVIVIIVQAIGDMLSRWVDHH